MTAERSANAESAILGRAKDIQKAVLSERVDLNYLRQQSRLPGGFLDNKLRAQIWPKILGINRYNIPDFKAYISPHRDDAQVRVDIDRSLWSCRENKDWTDQYRERRRQALSDVMSAILCRNSNLYYYQGFHDIVSVFLLVLDDDHLAFAVAEVVSIRYLLDFLAKDFTVLSKMMRLISTLLRLADPKLHSFLSEAGVEPFFATSWLITWWSHDVKSVAEIARIFDVMLCSHSLFGLYLCAALIIHLRDGVFRCDCDLASIFNFIVHAPASFAEKENGFPFEDILSIADKLNAQFPPERLKREADPEVSSLIESGRIESFRTPRHLCVRYVPADWVLLGRMRLVPPQSSVSSSSSGAFPHRLGLESKSSNHLQRGKQQGAEKSCHTTRITCTSASNEDHDHDEDDECPGAWHIVEGNTPEEGNDNNSTADITGRDNKGDTRATAATVGDNSGKNRWTLSFSSSRQVERDFLGIDNTQINNTSSTDTGTGTGVDIDRRKRALTYLLQDFDNCEESHESNSADITKLGGLHKLLSQLIALNDSLHSMRALIVGTVLAAGLLVFTESTFLSDVDRSGTVIGDLTLLRQLLSISSNNSN